MRLCFAPAIRCGCFLKNYVGVRPSNAKRSNTSAPRNVPRLPVRKPRVHAKGGAWKIDQRVGCSEMKTSRNLTMFKGKRRFDQASHASGRVEVSDVALQRSDTAKTLCRGGFTKGLRKRLNFNGVADACAGAVGLYVGTRVS